MLALPAAGFVAAYAALFEPRAARVVAVNPPASYREGPIFLGVLRVLDVTEALGLLAPTPLRLVDAPEPAFERTLEIYRAARATDQVSRTPAGERSNP